MCSKNGCCGVSELNWYTAVGLGLIAGLLVLIAIAILVNICCCLMCEPKGPKGNLDNDKTPTPYPDESSHHNMKSPQESEKQSAKVTEQQLKNTTTTLQNSQKQPQLKQQMNQQQPPHQSIVHRNKYDSKAQYEHSYQDVNEFSNDQMHTQQKVRVYNTQQSNLNRYYNNPDNKHNTSNQYSLSPSQYAIEAEYQSGQRKPGYYQTNPNNKQPRNHMSRYHGNEEVLELPQIQLQYKLQDSSELRVSSYKHNLINMQNRKTNNYSFKHNKQNF